LPPEVTRPAYDRSAVRTGVVHLGLGAFHRAHQAAVFDAALTAGDLRWGIVGVSMRSAAVRDQLRPQDCLYTIVERSDAGERLRIIGAIRDVLLAPAEPERVVDALAHPDVHLVTLTVTEKGYRLHPANGGLLEDDADVAADLADLSAPRTVPGFLVAGLRARRARGVAPFTVLSCDNLSHNGARLRGAVLAMARRHDADLAGWIDASVPFPNTMVDRIVPATEAADIAALAERLGVEDAAMVKTEPFLQWIIEDDFAGARPHFETLGVQLTADVAPWEAAKLRLLNGAHSAIAYLGGLAGIAHVDGFVSRATGRRFVEALWDETQTTLSPPDGLDLPAYRTALMARFANSALRHATRQIAMDGSQKIPQRLLAPIARRLANGQPIEALSLAVAAWMRWQSGIDDAGNRFAVQDPLAARSAAALGGTRDPQARVAALLAMEEVFPRPLAQDAGFAERLTDDLAQLEREGPLAVLDRRF
jgi:fructuronate reductase